MRTTETSLPRLAGARWRGELADWLSSADGLVLGLDFDGTLAPVVDDPDDATLDPAVEAALARLSTRPGVALAVVSGRSLSDLGARVDLPGAVVAGNHGLELARDDRRVVHPVAAEGRDRIDRLCARLDARLATIPGCVVENKGLTATVHLRTAPAMATPRIVEAVERAVAEAEGIRLTEGDQVYELRPAVAWDKGDAVRLLADATPDGWRPLYVGDDETDEDAFRALGAEGVGLRVVREDAASTTDDTAATYRLDGRAAVAPLLSWLADAAPRPSPAAAGGWGDWEPLAAPFANVE